MLVSYGKCFHSANHKSCEALNNVSDQLAQELLLEEAGYKYSDLVRMSRWGNLAPRIAGDSTFRQKFAESICPFLASLSFGAFFKAHASVC